MMSDREKVLQIMKYLHMSSVYQENEYKQARENVLKASPFDIQTHLDYSFGLFQSVLCLGRV